MTAILIAADKIPRRRGFVKPCTWESPTVGGGAFYDAATTPASMEAHTMALPTTPAWLEEPAKKVGALIAVVLAGTAAVFEVVATFSDLIPERYQAAVQWVVGATTLVAVVATRVQALLTRARVRPVPPSEIG